MVRPASENPPWKHGQPRSWVCALVGAEELFSDISPLPPLRGQKAVFLVVTASLRFSAPSANALLVCRLIDAHGKFGGCARTHAGGTTHSYAWNRYSCPSCKGTVSAVNGVRVSSERTRNATVHVLNGTVHVLNGPVHVLNG